MADNNQNWRNQSQQSGHDWDQNRNRYNQENESRNRENSGSYYGHAGYGYGAQDRDRFENEGYGSYNNDYENRVRYGNQQNDWRERQQRNQGQGSNWDRDQELGSTSNDYNSNRRQRNTGSGYSSQYGMENYGDSSTSGYRQNYGQWGYEGPGAGAGYYGNRGYRDQNYGKGREHDRDWWDKTKDEVSSWFGDEDAERRRRRDRVMSENYRGKGPKDYRRSEDRIREDVCDRLTDDYMLDATNIQIQVQGDEVVLSGSVNTREQKRRAEDIVDSISGVKNVENRIRVNPGSEGYTSGAIGTSSEKVRLSKDDK